MKALEYIKAKQEVWAGINDIDVMSHSILQSLRQLPLQCAERNLAP